MALSRIAPEARIVGAVALAVAVVAVPARGWPVLVGVGVLVAALLAASGVGLRWVATRGAVAVPFLLVALVLPFVATGERAALGPLTVSRAGAAAAALFAARCLLALGVALVLVAGTSASDLTEGLARLRLPAALVLVLTLMVRYLGVVRDDLRRMSVARASRGDGRGTVGRWVAAASGLGRLFVRSYERGERVHLAMVSRGYNGTPSPTPAAPVPTRHWVLCLAPAVATGLAAWGWPA